MTVLGKLDRGLWKVEATYVDDGEVRPSDLSIEYDPYDKELPFTLYQPGVSLYTSREELVALVGTAITVLVETATTHQEAVQMLKKLYEFIHGLSPAADGGQTTPDQP